MKIIRICSYLFYFSLFLIAEGIDKTPKLDEIKRALSPEGQIELQKYIDEYPEFNADKATREFAILNKNESGIKFSNARLKEIEDKADTLYVPFKSGEVITVVTRKKTYTGKYGGVSEGRVIVGVDHIPTVDLSPGIIDKTNPELMTIKKKNYVNDYFYTPKRNYEIEYNLSKKKYIKEQKSIYEKQKSEFIANKNIADKYPALSDKAIENIIDISDSNLKNTIISLIKEKYSRSQPLEANQPETLKTILYSIVDGEINLTIIGDKISTLSYIAPLEITINGLVYKDVKIVNISEVGIRIKHKDSAPDETTFFALSDLPEDMQKDIAKQLDERARAENIEEASKASDIQSSNKSLLDIVQEIEKVINLIYVEEVANKLAKSKIKEIVNSTQPESKKIADLENLLNSLQQKQDKNSATPDIMDKIVICKGAVSTGTGFITKIKEKYIVVTNMHVLMGNSELTLLNNKNKKLEYSSILTSADGRDLVFFLLKNQEDIPFLPLSNMDSKIVNIGEKIINYGNNQGAGVLTEETGTILGIGPDKIETDLKNVSGSSGSPVMLKSTGEVIAVVTYCSRERSDWTSANTRYVERREFALRIDTVDKIITVNILTYRRKALRLNNFQTYLISFIDIYTNLSSDISQRVNADNWGADFLKLDKLRKKMKRQIWELDNKCEKSIPYVEQQQEEYRDKLKKVEAVVNELSNYLDRVTDKNAENGRIFLGK